MRFVTIGYIERRKGQDVLIDAIEGLPEDISLRCEFVLIGQDDSLMAHELRERIADMLWIEMMGFVGRDRIHEVLDESDVLICPSREDPMPTVCAEAMMHKIPCLVSDATGTASYIRDGYNGLVFKNGNIDELKKKIIWCVEHPDEIKEMGSRSYEIYRNVFSMETFETNLLKYVSEMIGK